MSNQNGKFSGGEVILLPQQSEGKARRKRPRPVTVFGGQTDRRPDRGLRGWLYQHGINVGPSIEEIIEVERQGCIECREQLRQVRGALCIGFYSNKGGDGKSVLSTMYSQLFHYINPVEDRVVTIDVNTSMTTLDELNGLDKEDFLRGKYWTMESLYNFIVANGGDIEEFDDLNAKLAYRRDPQVPIIPLQLEPTKFDADAAEHVYRENSFTGEQYLVVLRVLKKFFTVIVHDFGTETGSSLTRTAFTQLHMLGILTHSGTATTKMVGKTLEMLHKNYTELLLNSVVIFNLTSPPSDKAVRAMAKEKAGKKPNYRRLVNRGSNGPKEVQTPGQALEVINSITGILGVVAPLTLEEIVLVGFDPHLKSESELRFSDVSPAVQAQLWTTMHSMLQTRAAHEAEFLKDAPEGTIIRREQMHVQLNERSEVLYWLSGLPERHAEEHSAHSEHSW